MPSTTCRRAAGRALAARLLPFAALALSGCPRGPRAGDPTASGFAAQYCGLLGRCCAGASMRRDDVACRAQVAAGLASGFDPAAGEACLADLRAGLGRDDFCDRVALSQRPSCQVLGVRRGRRPGQPCGQEADCVRSTDEGPVACAFGEGAQVCQVQLAASAEGAGPCVGYVERGEAEVFGDMPMPPLGYLCERERGLRCDKASGLCAPLGGPGRACRRDADCVPSAFCAGGVCAERAPLGARCAGGEGVACGEGAYCDAGGVCAAKLADGAACLDSAACLGGKCLGGKCGRGGSYVALGTLCAK